jgi:hypothetical protein
MIVIPALVSMLHQLGCSMSLVIFPTPYLLFYCDFHNETLFILFNCGFLSVGVLHESCDALNCHPFAGLNSTLHQLGCSLHESCDRLNCRFSYLSFHCDFHNETMKHCLSYSTVAVRQLVCSMGLAMLSTVAGRQFN